MIKDTVQEVKELLESYNDDTWQYAEGNAYYKERDANQVKTSRICGRISHITKDLDTTEKMALYNAVGSPKYLLAAFNLNDNNFLSDDALRAKELLQIFLGTSVALKKDDEWWNPALYLSRQILKPTGTGRMGMTGLFRSFFSLWTQGVFEEIERVPTVMEVVEFGAKQLDGIKVWDHRNDCEFKFTEIAKELTELNKKTKETKAS